MYVLYFLFLLVLFFIISIFFYYIFIHCKFFLRFFSDVDDNTADNIQWLKNNSKPWIKVLEFWEITSKNRQQSLKKNSITVHDYMDSFPALKCANGYLLVSILHYLYYLHYLHYLHLQIDKIYK